VGALIVGEDDEVLVVLQSGKVVRSAVAEVPAKGRDTMGVVFARFAENDRIIAVARNTERNLDDQDDAEIEPAGPVETVSPAEAAPDSTDPIDTEPVADEAGEDQSSNE
jgi:DNA gyrase subunit A